MGKLEEKSYEKNLNNFMTHIFLILVKINVLV